MVSGQAGADHWQHSMDMMMMTYLKFRCQGRGRADYFRERIVGVELAGWAGTIAYDILAGISQRVKRVYFE